MMWYSDATMDWVTASSVFLGFSGSTAVLGGLIAHSIRKKQKAEEKPEGSRFGIDHTLTRSERWMELANTSEKYRENAMRVLHGNATIDRLKEMAKELEEVPVVVQTPKPISFRPGEPQAFADATSQLHIVEALDVLVGNMDRTWPAIRPQMFVGGAGRGKTTMVKLLGNEINARLRELGLPPGHFVEAFGGDLDSAQKLDGLIRLASQNLGSVLFIDEVHSMPRVLREKLYMLLDRDFRYQYAGDTFPTPLGAFTVCFATTDRGELDEPLRLRMAMRQLERPTPEEMFHIAMHQAFDVDPEAANLAISRVHWDGSVRPLVNMLESAYEYAKAANRTTVRALDVDRHLRLQRIDEWGLTPEDRQIVSVLLKSGKPAKVKKGEEPRTVYSLSEASLTGWSRIDKGLYRDEIKPRLMDRGFLLSMSTGQTLTDAGVAYGRQFATQQA